MTDFIVELAADLGHLLQERGLKVTCAESCTGGGVARAITEIAGSSTWFEYGFVTYANEAKQQLLGVSPEALERWGAVSEAVVEQMAQGALQASDAHLAVAISGIAGPGGGTAEKPVGTVWFAWATHQGEVRTLCQCFGGDRGQVRATAVAQALEGLIDLAKNLAQ